MLCISTATAQENYTVKGKIFDQVGQRPIVNALVFADQANTSMRSNSNTDGFFNLKFSILGDYIIEISAQGYITKRIPISLENDNTLDLGIVYLERDIDIEKANNLIALTDSDLADDTNVPITSGLLKATRDIFLSRAAFDFGQAFFRVRGYGSENGQVRINGLLMNKFFDGRPQWNNWGGLNDVTRNQDFTNGLAASNHGFGGLLGATNIDTRPSGLRPGFRLSSSASNRTYAGRVMATYTSGQQDNGLSYSVSSSRRWSEQGYIRGTLYDAYSFFGTLEYHLNKKHSLGLTGILANNRRGRSTAITQEVFNLAGRRYNPFWGLQNGAIRNARERRIQEPIIILNHYFKDDKFQLNTGIAYQFGINARGRLNFFNAPNPDPTFFRYLPSFYINSPLGANFIGANLAREGFLNNGQLNWPTIFEANSATANQGRASYILSEDTAADTQFTANSTGQLTFTDAFKIDFGVSLQQLNSHNFARISDLLGADFHEDIDPFSDTRNDLTGEIAKTKGSIINYNYTIDADTFKSFAQLHYKHKNWETFIATSYDNTNYQREGLFQNERFLDTSLGKSERVSFSNFNIKSGFTYRLTGRHWLSGHAAYLNRPPLLQNIFINPRENNQVVPDITSEKSSSFDLNYFIRLPKLKGRLTTYYTRFQNATDVNFFFVESGVGSDFVQEVLTNLDRLHVGAELGLEYELSSTVKLSAVAAFGNQEFASNPNVTINFDTAGNEEELINVAGNIDLGVANIQGYKLAQGPQQAYALGVAYRDPKYWWISATANYLADNYANISTITRTQSFVIDPDTGQPFPNATEQNIRPLLAQTRLDDFYLLNLVGGKSWLINGKYISVFASVNNLFDTVFRTGGFEQSRNGNFGELSQDNVSGTPSFAPRFWYGFGRTYFLNVAISF